MPKSNIFKIIQVIQYFPPEIGGMEKQSYLLAKQLVSNGLNVEVITTGIRQLRGRSELKIKTSPTIGKNRSKLTTLLFALYTFFYLLCDILKGDRFIIHGYGALGIDKIIFHLLKVLFGIKYVIKMPGTFTEAQSRIYFSLNTYKRLPIEVIKKADGIIVQDSESIQNLAKIGFDKNKLVIIKNGVPIPYLNSNAITGRRKKKIGNRHCVLLFVGRVIEEKGVFLLSDTFNKLLNRYPHLKLWIVGSGKDFKRLQDHISSAEIQNIVLWGSLDQEKLERVYIEADIFVFPTFFREGIPNALLEAMSYQLPIISTPVGAIPHLIQNKKEGIFVSPNDLDSLRNSIHTLIKDPEFAITLGKNARKRVSKEFSMKRNCEEYIKLFNSLWSTYICYHPNF